MDFLDKSKIFSYRTIDPRETIWDPIKTFREFSLDVGRMANRKACGELSDKMPADLFKKVPEAFGKRAWILIHIILAGHYVYSEELLEVRVVLLCKDHGIALNRATRLYQQIKDQLHSAILFYQLINR